MVLVGMMCAGWIASGLGDIHGPRWMSGVAVAADALKIDSLSSDPKQLRIQVDQLISKTDNLIAKLKTDPNNQAIVLDLLQTRDDILREIPKIDSAPGDAKWTAQEMRDSVLSKLKLLKRQYDKAVGLTS
jgi:outer membrane murein-binding lipoprotein Lpp